MLAYEDVGHRCRHCLHRASGHPTLAYGPDGSRHDSGAVSRHGSSARAGKGEAHGLEALEAARSLEADVAYIDPPYNQHSYLGNYHVWETLELWDKPEV